MGKNSRKLDFFQNKAEHLSNFFLIFWHWYDKYFEGFLKNFRMGYFGNQPRKSASWNSDQPPYLAHSAFIFSISPQVSYPVGKRTPRAFQQVLKHLCTPNEA